MYISPVFSYRVTYVIKHFTHCNTSNLVACIGFSESKYSALESDGILTATLLLTGDSQLTPFNVTVIASITNDIIPSATGMWLDMCVCVMQLCINYEGSCHCYGVNQTMWIYLLAATYIPHSILNYSSLNDYLLYIIV